jgi:inorganic triphosphatase YgiF
MSSSEEIKIMKKNQRKMKKNQIQQEMDKCQQEMDDALSSIKEKKIIRKNQALQSLINDENKKKRWRNLIDKLNLDKNIDKILKVLYDKIKYDDFIEIYTAWNKVNVLYDIPEDANNLLKNFLNILSKYNEYDK